jgi:exonuclease III
MEPTSDTTTPNRGRDTILKLYSVNVRGLISRRRGELALMELALSKYNIFFIQETHAYKKTQIEKLTKIWKGQSYWDPGKAQSAGVAILIKENFPFKVNNIIKSDVGRYLIIDGVINEQKIRLTNTYFPNTNRHRLKLIETLKTLTPTTDAHIFAGDFNFVEDPDIDKSKGRKSSGAITRAHFKTYRQNNSLEDIFRKIYPNKREYTHIDKPTGIKTRIDRIYADRATAQAAIHVDHVINTLADHSAVTAHFKIQNNSGPGYWKCNVSTLMDPDFKEDFKALWEKLTNIDENSINLQWWEKCKLKFKEMIIWHSTRLAKNRADTLNNLDKEIIFLKKLHNCETGTQHPSISEKIAEKINILRYQTEGAKIDQKFSHRKRRKTHRSFLKHGEIKRTKETNH